MAASLSDPFWVTKYCSVNFCLRENVQKESGEKDITKTDFSNNKR